MRYADRGPFGQFSARARAEGWRLDELDFSHSPNVTAPDALMELFQRILSNRARARSPPALHIVASAAATDLPFPFGQGSSSGKYSRPAQQNIILTCVDAQPCVVSRFSIPRHSIGVGAGRSTVQEDGVADNVEK